MSTSKLALLFYIVAAPVLSGMGVTAVLTMRNSTTQMLIIAAIAGFVVAIPAAWLVARGLASAKR